MDNTIITNFPITVYGKMEKYSDTISRGRCRVFYKGHNRNGTYITDEFAEKLIQSAPYTPVKGIYEFDDYTDHGKKRSEGRIYGIVPMDHNFAWEKHVDCDGVEREYACFDVLYYTALYREAGEIDGKSESMQLYRDTLKGDWKIMDGKKTYVFTDGCFLGLQALGDDVEPCFEGASFYSLEDNIIALLEKYEKRTDLFQNHEQGGNIMPEINFKVSDNQKYDFLFRLLNPNFNEEGGWAMEYAICEVYDEYAIVRNFCEGIFERVYYTKDDTNDSLEITNKERCYIVDVNETERAALDSLKGEGTYAQAVEVVAEKDTTINSLNEEITSLKTSVETLSSNVNELTEQNSQYSTQIEELNNSISTLTIERDEAQENFASVSEQFSTTTAELNELNGKYATIVEERDILATYKKNVEDEAKKTVISGYIDQLSEDIIETYMNNLDNYTIEELDMKLTYEQKKANPTLFSKTPAPAPHAYLPKEDQGGRGISDILSKYER